MKVTATVLHNHSQDSFFRYHPQTSLLFHAHDFEFEAEGVSGAADMVWVLANVDDAEHLSDVQPSLTQYGEQVTSYRRRRNRSLSVGDVVVFREAGHLVGVQAVATIGWQELEFIPTFKAGTNETPVSESYEGLRDALSPGRRQQIGLGRYYETD